MRGSSCRSYVDGHNVYRMVRACGFPDINARRDDRIICEDKKDTCDGRLGISKTHILRKLIELV